MEWAPASSRRVQNLPLCPSVPAVLPSSVHSEYSLLDGANRVKDMAKRAAALDMPALAITDHGVMYGAIDHYEACVKEGIKPIIGCCLPGQLIYTAQGVKPIEEIEVGEMVLTHEGRYRPVVRTMTRDYSGTIYGVRAANANTVWLTDEHPIWLSVGQVGRKERVRADEIGLHAGRRAQKSRGRRIGTLTPFSAPCATRKCVSRSRCNWRTFSTPNITKRAVSRFGNASRGTNTTAKKRQSCQQNSKSRKCWPICWACSSPRVRLCAIQKNGRRL